MSREYNMDEILDEVRKGVKTAIFGREDRQGPMITPGGRRGFQATLCDLGGGGPPGTEFSDSRVADSVYEIASGIADGQIKDPKVTIDALKAIVEPGRIPDATKVIRVLYRTIPSLIEANNLFEYRLDLLSRPMEMTEGLRPCPRCKSTDTNFATRQTRSSDEAPLILLICNTCNKTSNMTHD